MRSHARPPLDARRVRDPLLSRCDRRPSASNANSSSCAIASHRRRSRASSFRSMIATRCWRRSRCGLTAETSTWAARLGSGGPEARTPSARSGLCGRSAMAGRSVCRAALPSVAGDGRRVGLRPEPPCLLAARPSRRSSGGGGGESPAGASVGCGSGLLRRCSNTSSARDLEPQGSTPARVELTPHSPGTALRAGGGARASARVGQRSHRSGAGGTSRHEGPHATRCLRIPPPIYVGELLGVRARRGREGSLPVPPRRDAEPSCLRDRGAGLVLLLVWARRVDLRPRGRALGIRDSRARFHSASYRAARAIHARAESLLLGRAGDSPERAPSRSVRSSDYAM